MFHILLGGIGAFLFATCSIPQVIKTWKKKSASDLSWIFLVFWFLGEVLTPGYIVIDDIIESITHFPLYVNYTFNMILVLYLPYAKFSYPDRGKTEDHDDLAV